jgi:hypothetical protein
MLSFHNPKISTEYVPSGWTTGKRGSFRSNSWNIEIKRSILLPSLTYIMKVVELSMLKN